MQQIVSITGQGQITIPASMRRTISLDLYNKALIKTENEKIVIEPIVDLLSLGGILKHRAKKQKNIHPSSFKLQQTTSGINSSNPLCSNRNVANRSKMSIDEIIKMEEEIITKMIK